MNAVTQTQMNTQINYRSRREAEQAIVAAGYVAIGRGEFTKGNMLAWTRLHPNRRDVRISTTFNVGK